MLIEIISTSLFTAAAISLALWLFKAWILERLKSDIKYENDAKLESLRSDLRFTNEKLSSIASAGSKAHSLTHAELLPHKIDAIRALWVSVLKWNEMSVVSMTVSIISSDWIRKNGTDSKTKKFFETSLKDPQHLLFLKERNDIEYIRPFVSERVWALYHAYNSFYAFRILRASFFLFPSLDIVEIFGRINEKDLIQKSAPQSIVDKYNSNIIEGTNEYLNYLKTELIKEFHSELSVELDSSRAAYNTAEVINAANKLASATSKIPEANGEEIIEDMETLINGK